MQYMIVVYGHRLAGYGPFESVSAARDHAAKYFQDYRTEIIDYNEVVEPEYDFDPAPKYDGF